MRIQILGFVLIGNPELQGNIYISMYCRKIEATKRSRSNLIHINVISKAGKEIGKIVSEQG